ncbi:MAG: ribonucleoside triphosphate reductase [Bacteroidota bacterium]
MHGSQFPSEIVKRDGSVVPFEPVKITFAIYRALKAVGKGSWSYAEELAGEVIDELQLQTKIPSVEQVQDMVENLLMRIHLNDVAKAYILYRKQHEQLRNESLLLANSKLIDDYLEVADWRDKESANSSYSLQGLNQHIATTICSNYWLDRVYPTEVSRAYRDGDIHIHDLGFLSVYCVGWDLQDLLLSGFRGVSGKVESKPARHFRTALGQITNFFYTLQGEAAGAQAFANFDTYLAPFIYYDKLTYVEVKQALQEFLFNLNVPTRVGFQTPFTNITLDLKVPDFMKNQPVIYAGQYQNKLYGEFQAEMDMLNRAFAEVMLEGDAAGRLFSFPIPTYNITTDFDWDNPLYDGIWEMTAKYGVPYFSNFINSDLHPDDVRSMCCRLRIDKRELSRRGGGLFASNPLTGSVGVVTLNLPRIGYQSKNEEEFFTKLSQLIDIASTSLEVKRKVIENLTERGLYPYSKFYLRDIKKRYGKYWANHFSTIGIVGMNECCLNFLGVDISQTSGYEFSIKVMDFIREKLAIIQEETGNIYNLEATPAESTSYRLARMDKRNYPDLKVANTEKVLKGAKPYYTNSTQLPVSYTNDLYMALKHQENLQEKYTGGTVFHIFLGEKQPDPQMVKLLIKKVLSSFRLPYITLSPTFSICPTHGYLYGEHKTCPKCSEVGQISECEVFSRIVGYIRPVQQWNEGKQSEFDDRKLFDHALKNN